MNEDVEFGYNRDKENLGQINMGMFFGEESKLPVFYTTYYGSITDKTHMRTMLDNGIRLGIKNAGFVMDRGFFTADNLTYLVGVTKSFIIGMLLNGLKKVKRSFVSMAKW